MTKEKKTLKLSLKRQPTGETSPRSKRKRIYIPVKKDTENRQAQDTSPFRSSGKKKESANKHKLALRKLEKEFPKVFNLSRPRPLDKGIRTQLLAKDKEVSNKSVRLGLFFYCNSHQYLRAVVEGTLRVNANGRFTKKVTKEEEIEAKDRLRKLFSSIKRSKN